MSKIRVLVLNSDMDGVGFHRLLNPHITLQEQFPDDFQIDVRMLADGTIPLLDERFLSQYQIILYNKMLPINPEYKSHFLTIVRKYCIKLVFDIDDYWILNDTHINYKQWRSRTMKLTVKDKAFDYVSTDDGLNWNLQNANLATAMFKRNFTQREIQRLIQSFGDKMKVEIGKNSQEQVEESLREADYVVTTSPIFAQTIRGFNPNVIILPNAVNLKEQQWISNKTQSDKVRFIWGGGICICRIFVYCKTSLKNLIRIFYRKLKCLCVVLT